MFKYLHTFTNASVTMNQSMHSLIELSPNTHGLSLITLQCSSQCEYLHLFTKFVMSIGQSMHTVIENISFVIKRTKTQFSHFQGL